MSDESTRARAVTRPPNPATGLPTQIIRPAPGEVRCRWTATVAYLDRTTTDGRRLLSGTAWTYRLPAPLAHRRIHVGHVTTVRRDRHPDPTLDLWVLRAEGTLLYGVHPRVLELMRSGQLQAELTLGRTQSYMTAAYRPLHIFTAAEVVGVVASTKVGVWPTLPPLVFTLEEDCP